MSHAPAVFQTHAFLQVAVLLHVHSVMAEVVDHQLADLGRGDRRFHESFLSRCLVASRMGHLEFIIGIRHQTACLTPVFPFQLSQALHLARNRACLRLALAASTAWLHPGAAGGDAGSPNCGCLQSPRYRLEYLSIAGNSRKMRTGPGRQFTRDSSATERSGCQDRPQVTA